MKPWYEYMGITTRVNELSLTVSAEVAAMIRIRCQHYLHYFYRTETAVEVDEPDSLMPDSVILCNAYTR